MGYNSNWKRQRRDPRTGRFLKGSGGGSSKRISASEEARQDQAALPEEDLGINPPKGLSGAKLAQWYLKNVPVIGGKQKSSPKGSKSLF